MLARGRHCIALWFAVAVAAHGAASAAAFTVGGCPDEILAEHPVIVVGRWNKTPVTVREKIVNNTRVEREFHTQFVVERVIKGDVKPGVLPVVLNAFVGWLEADGGPIFSLASNMEEGDIDDVVESNLWFLTQERSWDETDPKVYLRLENHRSVQPLVLEPYFRALAGERPRDDVPKLLATGEELVAVRVLMYLGGDVEPWPFFSNFNHLPIDEVRTHPMLVRYAADAGKLIDRQQPRVRRLAAAVYADLGAADVVARMRTLLSDSDAVVRAIAIGTLVRHRDAESYDKLPKAVRGLEDAAVAAQLIDRLAEQDLPVTIPVLIELLETRGRPFDFVPLDRIPASLAAFALKKKTGSQFPFDVAASRYVWNRVAANPDRQARDAELAKLLPDVFAAVTGILIGDGGKYQVQLTNRSSHDVVIAKRPDTFRMHWPVDARPQEYRPRADDAADEFIVLKSKESYMISIPGDIAWRDGMRSVTLEFFRPSKDESRRPWMGTVVAQPLNSRN
jgi:hypothetical protein